MISSELIADRRPPRFAHPTSMIGKLASDRRTEVAGSAAASKLMATVQRGRAVPNWSPASWIPGAIVAVLVMSWRKRLCYAIVLAAASGLAAHLFGALAIGFRDSSRGLPISASARAIIFARAWAAQDTEGMTRFVRPADEAKLRAWITANPVPSQVADMQNRTVRTISAVKDDLDGEVVNVRIFESPAKSSGASSSGVSNKLSPRSGGFVLRMMWSYTGGNWLFSPDMARPATVGQQVAQQTAQPPIDANRTIGSPYSAATGVDPPSWSTTSRNTDRPAPQSASRNVVIPTMVPPWARAR